MKHSMRIFVLGSCALLVSSVVSGYVLLKPKRSWDSPPTYIVDNRGSPRISGDGGEQATIDAITSNLAWNGAGSGTVINAVSGSVEGSAFRLGDGVPMLNFRDPTGQCSGNCLAATFTGFYERRSKGRVVILDADIVTNTGFDWTSVAEGSCSGEFYIEGVQVHEIGHGLGLGHTNVGDATMYPSVSSCNNGPATIEQDDKDGLNALYGSSDGGGDPGGGSCELPSGEGQPGDTCSANGDCCSGKCRGKPGAQTCR